jgi:hypothetical protein
VDQCSSGGNNFYGEVVGGPVHREWENWEFVAHSGAPMVWCFSQARRWWCTPFVRPGWGGGVTEVAVIGVQLGGHGEWGKTLSLVAK